MEGAVAHDPITELASRVAIIEGVYHSYLSWVGVIIGSLTILIIVAGLLSFSYLRYEAQRRARIEAERVAAQIAEQRINEYFQEKLPEVFADYREYFAKAVGPAKGDGIGEGQEDAEGAR